MDFGWRVASGSDGRETLTGHGCDSKHGESQENYLTKWLITEFAIKVGWCHNVITSELVDMRFSKPQ